MPILSANLRATVVIYLALYSSVSVYAIKDKKPGSVSAKTLTIPLDRIFKYQIEEKLDAIEYVGKISIGTPSQDFRILFDSTAQEVWVPEHFWKSVDDNLRFNTGYNCTRSSSCGDKGTIFATNYRGIDLYSTRYVESVTIRTRGNVRSPPFQLQFLAVYRANESDLKHREFDGVFGLAPVRAYKSTAKNALLAILKTLENPEEKFGFWFNPNLNNLYGGELSIGGADKNRYTGRIAYYPLTADDTWQIESSVIKIGNMALCESTCKMIFDTGVNWLSGPERAVQIIRETIDAYYSDDHWQVNCDHYRMLQPLIIYYEENAYEIKPDLYIRQIERHSTKLCLLAIKAGHRDRWIMGIPFMASYYTVFDFGGKKIGIAQRA